MGVDDYEMPPLVVPRSSIIFGPTDLDDGKLTLKTLDVLVDKGLDLTGLTWTRTGLGNVYRQYRLFAS